MKILVTGAAGNLGHVLVELLMVRGHEVWGIDPQPWRGETRPHRFEVVDPGDRAAVYRTMEGADAVVHMGEISNVLHRIPASETFQRNATISSHVFEACGEYGVKRIVYTSSCQVYGMSFPGGESFVPPRYLPFDETHPVQPDNVYAASKVASENYAHLVHVRYGIPVAIFRFPAIFREWNARRSRQILSVPAPGEGYPFCGFGTYVFNEDAAMVLALAVESERPGYEVYHANNEKVALGMSLQEYIADYYPDFPALPEGWPADRCPMLTEKVREHFDWRPERSIEDFQGEP